MPVERPKLSRALPLSRDNKMRGQSFHHGGGRDRSSGKFNNGNNFSSNEVHGLSKQVRVVIWEG